MGLLVAAVVMLAFVVLMVTGFPSASGVIGGSGVPVPSVAPAAPAGPGVPAGPAAPPVMAQPSGGVGGVRRFSHYSRGRGYRDWRTRGDPTLINSLWRSRQPLGIRKQLGNAEVYIVLALLIGFVTVVIGCWLSDNCWSPEPEHVVTLA